MESLDYDIVARLAEAGPSTPALLARDLRASGPYLRRRLLHLTQRRIVERVGRGLYRLPEPPPHEGPETVALQKLKTTLALRQVASKRSLESGIEMSDFWNRPKARRAPPMMTAAGYGELFNLTLSIVRRHRVPHMFVGAVAVYAWGEPRFSRDIDVVITARREGAKRVISGLLAAGLAGPRPEEVVLQAFYHVPLHPEKIGVDIWIKKSKEMLLRIPKAKRPEFQRWMQYDDAAFERRTEVKTPDGRRTLWVARPEDIIISKVHFSAKDPARRYKDERDICSILLRQGRSMDRRYMVRWLRALGLHTRFQRIEETCLPAAPRRRAA